MDATNKKLLGDFDNFVSTYITKKERIAILHDLDPDGICSGVLSAHAVNQLRGKKIDLRLQQKPGEIPLSQETLKKLKEKKISVLISTDKALDQDSATIHKALKFCKVLVIDHHKLYDPLENSKDFVMVKPQLLGSKTEPSKYCTAKLAYDLWNRHVPLNQVAWKACPGIIGDVAYTAWKKFVDTTLGKYNYVVHSDPFHNQFGKIAEMISHVECYDDTKLGQAFETLLNANHPKEMLASPLKKYSKIVKKEISYYITHVKKLAEIHNDKNLIFYVIRPKYNIKSNISTILSMQHRDKTLILCSPGKDNMIHLSLRRQDGKIAMNELVEKATLGLEGGGGGHVPAAGGRVSTRDFEKFKENVLRLLDKIKKIK